MGTINELNTTDELADDDKLVLWKTQSGATRAITAENMAAYFGAEPGGPFQSENALLTSIAALGPTTTADRMIYTTAQNVAALTPLTSFARTLLDDADAATARTTLGITNSGSIDEILLSNYAATQAGFAQAVTDAITAGKWLNGEEIEITLTSLITITLTDNLRWRNVRLYKAAQSSGDYEYSVTVNGPDFDNVTTLGANAAINAATLTVSSATNIVAGAKYLLISNADYNADPGAYGNTVAQKSEWIRVADTYTSGTSVALAGALQSSYTTATTARIYRFLETAVIEWDNVVIRGGGIGEAQGAVRFNKCVVERFSDCGSLDNEFTAFTFNLCGFNSYISATIKNSDLIGYGYGIEAVGCDAPLIDWVWGENVRHVVTRGSSYQTTLPFSGGNRYILGRGGVTGMVTGLRCTGSIDDTHTGHIGHNISAVAGDIVPGNTQEAVTIESHAITIDSIRVTGSDLPVSVLYYGHPADEPLPAVSLGTVDVGYGGSSTNSAVIVLNRDAQTRNHLYTNIESINGRWPALLYAGGVQGEVSVMVGTVTGITRTHHSVQAVSSANGRANISIRNPNFVEDSGNASIYAILCDGDLWHGAFAGQLGSFIDLGTGNITADNTAFYANDGRITINGTRGTATKIIAGIGTVFTPNEVKSSIITEASAIPLTSGSTANITSVSVEPGTWSVSGVVGFLPAASTSVTRFGAAINTESGTFPVPETLGTAASIQTFDAFVPGFTGQIFPTGDAIITVTTTTTVYLIARSIFTVSTMDGYGKIQAIRLS